MSLSKERRKKSGERLARSPFFFFLNNLPKNPFFFVFVEATLSSLMPYVFSLEDLSATLLQAEERRNRA